jgi:glutamine amidotransferase
MCRIFGFRSVLDSQVHRSLLSADNALAVQSSRHPDGWGVAYYAGGAPHVIKSTGTAATDHLFRRVSGVVTSQTVLAHIRRATQGDIHTLNCHPFQFGRWVMAHNGDIPAFPRVREQLVQRISPTYRRFVLGDTDSEVVFHLFLSHLAAHGDLTRRGTSVDAVIEALRATVWDVHEVTASDPEREAWLTLVVTDGELMVAHQGGKDLHFSTHKVRCPDREGCAFAAASCEAPVDGGHVNHLIVSSEPLQGDNVWTALEPGEIVAVDSAMRLRRARSTPGATHPGRAPHAPIPEATRCG